MPWSIRNAVCAFSVDVCEPLDNLRAASSPRARSAQVECLRSRQPGLIVYVWVHHCRHVELESQPHQPNPPKPVGKPRRLQRKLTRCCGTPAQRYRWFRWRLQILEAGARCRRSTQSTGMIIASARGLGLAAGAPSAGADGRGADGQAATDPGPPEMSPATRLCRRLYSMCWSRPCCRYQRRGNVRRRTRLLPRSLT